jgi:hypothetical protein
MHVLNMCMVLNDMEMLKCICLLSATLQNVRT